MSLKNFKISIDGYSMFHYFAKNADVMEKIHGKVQKCRDLGYENEYDKRLPLMIICPDNEGKTALYHAISS